MNNLTSPTYFQPAVRLQLRSAVAGPRCDQIGLSRRYSGKYSLAEISFVHPSHKEEPRQTRDNQGTLRSRLRCVEVGGADLVGYWNARRLCKADFHTSGDWCLIFVFRLTYYEHPVIDLSFRINFCPLSARKFHNQRFCFCDDRVAYGCDADTQRNPSISSDNQRTEHRHFLLLPQLGS